MKAPVMKVREAGHEDQRAGHSDERSSPGEGESELKHFRDH